MTLIDSTTTTENLDPSVEKQVTIDRIPTRRSDSSALTSNDEFQWWRMQMSVPDDRSRERLVYHAAQSLTELSGRQGRPIDRRSSALLRLVACMSFDGAPTPQIADNGEGGPWCEWLVNGRSLVIDCESEAEILISYREASGDVEFSGEVTSRWSPADTIIATAKSYLEAMAAEIENPLELGPAKPVGSVISN